MTQARRNFCKAVTGALIALMFVLALFAGGGILGVFADGEPDSLPTSISKVTAVAVNGGGTVQFVVVPASAFKLNTSATLTDTGNVGAHISGKRYAKTGYEITEQDKTDSDNRVCLQPDKFFYRKFGYGNNTVSDTIDLDAFNAYDETRLQDYYKNILVNGHDIEEWWNGVQVGDKTEYKTLYMSISDGIFDIQNYVTHLNDAKTEPKWTLTAFKNGDTILLKKGLKLCSRNKTDVVADTWSYHVGADGKEVVLDRDMQFKFVVESGKEDKDGKWVLDEEALSEQATTIAYRNHSAPAPSMFDIMFEADKYAPAAKGTAAQRANGTLINAVNVPAQTQWKQCYEDNIKFYDNILINGYTPWQWENGVEINGETVKKDWGIHISHESNWVTSYGGDYIRFDGGSAFADGDTIVFNSGFTMIEKVGSADNDWTYYAGADGKRAKTNEKLMFQMRNGKWMRTDLDAIAQGVDANGKVTLATSADKKYNLAVTVSDNLFTNEVGEGGFKGINFEAKRADAAYTDFFDNILFNGKTANEWYTAGVNGVKADFNIHVTADGLKISKKDLSGGNIEFQVGDTVRFVGGFSFPSFDNDAWGFYTNEQGKRVIIKSTVEYTLKQEGNNLVWKKTFGVFKDLEFKTLPESEPVVAVGSTVQYAATAVKVNPDDDEIAEITYASSDTDVATVSADGTVTGKKIGYTTITATIKDASITANYEIFVYDGNAKPENGMIAGGKLYIPMGKSNGEYYISDPLQKGLKSVGYTVEEATGTSYDYKITVSANLYTNARRPKDLILPVYYGKGGGAKGDVMLTDGTGRAANKNTGYLLAAGDVEYSAKAANGTDETDIISWKTAHELALTVNKTSGEALITFAAYLPASPAYHGVFGEVVAKEHKLGEFKALIVLEESENLETAGKFLSARANETGDCLFDYGQWNQALNNGNGKWITYPISYASDHVDGSLWKGWNNFQHTATQYYNNVKEDFFDKILINGMTHKEYSAKEGVDLNIHMRSEYLQIRQYGASGQADAGKMRQWKDGTTIEFKKGFRLIEKHKDGIEGSNNGGKQIECTVCYLHEDTGRYWTLGFDQKYVFVADETSPKWLCYNDIAEVTVDKTEAWLKPGETLKLNATAVKAVADSDMVGTSLTFSSSDETVATVDENGLITATDKEGTAVITVMAEDGTSVSCNVTVSKQSQPDGDGNDDGDSGCGCGNNIAASSLIGGAILLVLAGVAITLAKKKSNKA